MESILDENDVSEINVPVTIKKEKSTKRLQLLRKRF